MRETELVDQIEQWWRHRPASDAHVLVGPGDDCAVVQFGAQPMLLSVDQLVAGRHIAAAEVAGEAGVDRVARKAMARALSDIAAMGGRPACALAAAGIPGGFAHASLLAARLACWADHWGCPLIGGDLTATDGPLSLAITVVGWPHPQRGPVLRAGAQPGDLVAVTGRVGGAVRSGRHGRFEPRLREGARLCDLLGSQLHAMIDLSDGLGLDAARLARASGVRIELEVDRIPMAEQVDDWRSAIAEGEDYELCLCVSPSAGPLLRLDDPPTPVSVIGRVRAGAGCVFRCPDGTEQDGGALGWVHALGPTDVQ